MKGLWGSQENSSFRGEGVTKKQCIGGIAEKGGAWTVCRFKGGLTRKRGWSF